MKRILINKNEFNETRLAVLENGYLSNLELENKKNISKKGNIYKGIVTKVEPSLDAVFVKYGADKDGFLPFKEITNDYFNFTPIVDKSSIIKGKELIVQVEKDARDKKSAALTTYISLAGSYIVLMPSSPSLEGISKQIDGKIRNDLKEKLTNINIPDDMGIIVRTAGMNKNLEELTWDLNVLLSQYKIVEDLYKRLPAPSLIHEESDLIVRSIRDYLRSDVKDIIIDNIEIFNCVYKHLNSISSDFIGKIRLYNDNIPLFSKYKVEQQIELAFKREIFLPSGGSIILDSTEALISIDVNSAKSNKCLGIKETALQTNLEAINEIARQMRLRDLGGLIVVDFIDMPDISNQKVLEKELRDLISLDKAKIQINKISKFGLLEMSRQRIKSSLSESSQDVCIRCNGTGKIDNMETLSRKILRSIEEESFNAKQINVEVPIKLMTYLTNIKKYYLFKIEKKHNICITLLTNEQLRLPDYKIYKIKHTKSNIEYKELAKDYNDNKYIKTFNIKFDNDRKNKHVSKIIYIIMKHLAKKKKKMSGSDLLSHFHTIIGAA